MRLSQYHKEAFVASVMNDLPQVDYQPILKKIVMDEVLAIANLAADLVKMGWPKGAVTA